MSKTPIALTVNGRAVSGDVEPRTHLADFLREDLLLTGTHLGCEQGVCGACTVMIDGRPSRSCITFAVACDAADVRTIESFDDDPLDGPTARRVYASSRSAMRLLHAGTAGLCVRHCASHAGRRQRPYSQGNLRQSMSLHGVSGRSQCDCGCSWQMRRLPPRCSR